MNRTAARSVTVIPPTINPLTHLSKVTIQKRRVAGYARVSTDSDEQFTSYEAQVDTTRNTSNAIPNGSLLRFTPTRAFPAQTPSIALALMK